MKAIFNRLQRNGRKNDRITIVSGLPRSGTSMMMQMLEAGGMPVMTDNLRKADEDNPRGYYEFEKVKKIKEDTSWLEDCHGKTFKMVSALLYHLPQTNRYKVIFMKREIEELLASQRVMLERKGVKDNEISDERMAKNFEKHLEEIENWLEGKGYIDVLYIKYNDIISDPVEKATLVNSFLGGSLDTKKMARVVEKSLYRQRKT